MGGIGYKFGWGQVFGVWRYLDYNFKSSAKIEDVDFNGPAIGVAFNWQPAVPATTPPRGRRRRPRGARYDPGAGARVPGA